MQAFKHFHDDWLDYSALDGPGSINRKIVHLNVNLSLDFFSSLLYDKDSLTNYKKDAVKHMIPTLGKRPALCLSGGVDSQAMVEAFYEAGYTHDVYTLRFNDNLNIHDYSHAVKFAESKNIKLNTIDLNIHHFLTRENQDYAIKYNCYSPHFNTHFKLYNLLQSMGYTSVVAGGNAPQAFTEGDKISWGGGYGRNVLSFIKYSQISGFLCQGNFLSYYPKLAWAIAVLTPISNFFQTFANIPYKEKLARDKERYKDKVEGYRRAGFNIVPQETKFTGFELVKKYYEDKSNDGWAFEKLFRYPIERMLKADTYGLPEIYLPDEYAVKLLELHRNNSLSIPSSGIAVQS